MAKANKKELAIDAYIAKAESIKTMLFRLTQAAEDFYGDDPESINWGHVGNLGGIEEQLTRICDQVFKEGEHALENN